MKETAYLPLLQLLSKVHLLSHRFIQLTVGLHQLHSCLREGHLKVRKKKIASFQFCYFLLKLVDVFCMRIVTT